MTTISNHNLARNGSLMLRIDCQPVLMLPRPAVVIVIVAVGVVF